MKNNVNLHPYQTRFSADIPTSDPPLQLTNKYPLLLILACKEFITYNTLNSNLPRYFLDFFETYLDRCLMSSATVKEKTMPIDNVDCASEIFSEYGEFILKVIRYHAGSEEEAEDLFQDFFLSLVCNPIPANIKNIKGYLYRAIVNETVDAARRVVKYRSRIHKYAKNLNYSVNKSMPEDALIEEEEINKMLRLIEKQLPPREAKAIALRYMSNRSIKDIAKKMYVKKRSVSRYISAGLNKVRQFLILKQGDQNG